MNDKLNETKMVLEKEWCLVKGWPIQKCEQIVFGEGLTNTEI